MKTPKFPWSLVLFGVLVVSMALLSGCATTAPDPVVRVVERRVEVPKSLITCSAEPVAGSIWVTQRDIARYMVKLAAAGEDCRVKLSAVRKLVAAE